MRDLDRAIQEASVFMTAAEILKIAKDEVDWNAKSWFKPDDPFKSLSNDELKRLKPLRKQEIVDALTVGSMEAETVQTKRCHINKDRALSLLRHTLSLKSGLTVGDVQEALDKLTVELVMEI